MDGDTSVHFIVLDAMSILLRKYEWEEQIQWYNDTLSSSTADWKVINQIFIFKEIENISMKKICNQIFIFKEIENI